MLVMHRGHFVSVCLFVILFTIRDVVCLIPCIHYLSCLVSTYFFFKKSKCSSVLCSWLKCFGQRSDNLHSLMHHELSLSFPKLIMFEMVIVSSFPSVPSLPWPDHPPPLPWSYLSVSFFFSDVFSLYHSSCTNATPFIACNFLIWNFAFFSCMRMYC